MLAGVLLLTDSVAKYVAVNGVVTSAHKGHTVLGLADKIRFDNVSVRGFSIIILHVGTNDIANSVISG